jgi:hypothetical protein
MGNSNTSERESYSSTQELIEINKLAQQYLILLFKDDNLAIRDYDESREDFMFRTRPSIYLFDKLTFEQKKILVSEFYNINQELKYKILNTKDKLKYLQHYELSYKQCGGVSKYSSTASGNFNPDYLKLEQENERLKVEIERLKLENKNRQPSEMKYEELFGNDPLFSNAKNCNRQPIEMKYEELFSSGNTQQNKMKYKEIIKLCAYKLADWDNYICGNIPRTLVNKSPVYYKDMLEDNLNELISINDLLMIINDLYIEIDNVEINCYKLKTINESEAMLILNEIIIKDKYYKNNKINNITEKFIPNTLGVRGETNRNGQTSWYGVDNYISLIKQRINIFKEFYSNIL